MPSLRIGPGGTIEVGASQSRMLSFTPGAANINPPKRIARIQELLKTQSPKIAIIRGEGIGDVIMTTPCIRALKELFNNNISISYATNTLYSSGALVKILKHNPDITEILDRDSLDESNYDTVLNLHCPAIGYEKFGNPPVNRIDLFASHLGLGELKDPLPKIYLTRKEIDEGTAFCYRAGLYNKKVVMVQIFGTSPSRSIDSTKVRNALIQLYNQYGIHSIIMTHDTDKQTDIIWSDVPGSLVVKGKDCREIAAIMISCDLVLCPDSSFLHIAGALGVPTVALFGPTDPRARVNYYANAVAIWEGEKLGGHPHWYEACPYGNLCWKLITEEAIVNSCINHINNTKRVNPDSLLIRKEAQIQSESI